jgi:MoaA/NifB/PqqE/SkfB family radical SAM enzyme
MDPKSMAAHMERTMNNGNRPIGVFDLTSECPLRCTHCYFYTDVGNIPEDLEDDVFLARLERTRDQYGIRSAFWIGGEPLLKPELLRRAMDLFPRNAIATSGALPIPGDLDCGLLVSIDGPREAHDALRGEGAYDTAMVHMHTLPPKSFALNTTLATSNVEHIGTLPEVLEETGALGILVGFHVGRPDDPERLSPERRDRAVDELLELHDTHPGVLLNSRESIELFRSSHNAEISKGCIYRDKAPRGEGALHLRRERLVQRLRLPGRVHARRLARWRWPRRGASAGALPEAGGGRGGLTPTAFTRRSLPCPPPAVNC